jgi:hypothetical protein
MRARAEKTAHIQEQPTEQQIHENEDDGDETIDRELERVHQKILQLQKEKENSQVNCRQRERSLKS